MGLNGCLSLVPDWLRWSCSPCLEKVLFIRMEKGTLIQCRSLMHLLRRPSPKPEKVLCLWIAGSWRELGSLKVAREWGRTAVTQGRTLRVSVEMEEGDSCLPGPCLGVWSLLWISPLLSLLVASSVKPPCLLVLGVWVENSEGMGRSGASGGEHTHGDNTSGCSCFLSFYCLLLFLS